MSTPGLSREKVAGEGSASSAADALIRNISDTARWVAVYRAQETERPDALFRDPFARRLAGERGEQIAASRPLRGDSSSWPMVARTYLIDRHVNAGVAEGVDMVVNLAAGLDTRPYRMNLPATLQWVEVDLPEILAYKEEILREEKPVCSLERIRLNLLDVPARRKLFDELSRRAKKVLIITEGLITYLESQEVAELAKDLAAPANFQILVLDIASPRLLRMLKQRMKPLLREAAPFRFAPEEGPQFFAPLGWRVAEVDSLLKTAGRVKRLSGRLRLFSWLPEGRAPWRRMPWSGVCLLRK